jgi:2-iminobutanoate/2-iminopropanoate deaminase
MPRTAVTAPGAVAVGPYSQGVEADRLVFLSGQTPLDPETGALVGGGIEEQTRRCLDNLAAVLEGAGLGLDDVVKCTVFLTDISDFAAMNAAYRGYFTEPFPARTTIGVAALPLGAAVEIEMVALRP